MSFRRLYCYLICLGGFLGRTCFHSSTKIIADGMLGQEAIRCFSAHLVELVATSLDTSAFPRWSSDLLHVCALSGQGCPAISLVPCFSVGLREGRPPCVESSWRLVDM